MYPGLSFEIAHWTASATARREHATLVEPALAVLRTKTPHPVFTGVGGHTSTDDGPAETDTFFVVVAWDETATHRAFSASPAYTPFLDTWAPLFPAPAPDAGTETDNNKVAMLHAHFAAPGPLPALSASLTEHVVASPRAGVAHAALADAAAQLCEALGTAGVPAAVGAAEEDEGGAAVLLVGWPSRADRDKALGPGGYARAQWAALDALVDGESRVVAQVVFVRHQ